MSRNPSRADKPRGAATDKALVARQAATRSAASHLDGIVSCLRSDRPSAPADLDGIADQLLQIAGTLRQPRAAKAVKS